MSVDAFLMVFGLSCGALALWIALRFPRIAPQSMTGIVGHLALAALVPALTTPLLPFFVARLGAVPALLLIAMPAVTYLFLAGAWLVLYAQRHFARYSR